MAQARPGQRRNRGQQGQPAQQGQPRQQLSMNDALATLQAMFDSVDRAVIQMVLVEGCSGNMEQAVEALLKITENQASGGGGSSGNNGAAAPAAPAAFGLPQPNEDAVTRATKSKRNQQQQRGRVDKRRNKEEMNAQLAQRAQSHRDRDQQQQGNAPNSPPANGRVVNLPDDFLRPPSYYLERFPKDRRSNEEINNQHNSNNSNKNSDPNFDQKAEREKQIIEDEIFAKAIFEDALFAQDLMNHPEWISDSRDNEFGLNNNRNRSQTQVSSNNNNNRLKSPFGKNPFRSKRSNSSGNLGGDNNNSSDIDPSNPQARKAKFKENLNSLGDAAKSRMMNLASKLQRNKEDKRKGNKGVAAAPSGGGGHNATYSNVLKSIDDETLIDDADDALEIDMASEQNRGTYRPPKPAQAL